MMGLEIVWLAVHQPAFVQTVGKFAATDQEDHMR